MYVYFANFSKKLNSTAKPTFPEGSFYIDCKLKAPCNVLKPVLEFTYTQSSVDALIPYNYAYIPVFERYYYIKNWHFVNLKTVCELEVDVLATYQDAIFNSYQYVLRSYSRYDGGIVDMTYPITADAPSVIYNKQNNPLQPPSTGYGVFVIGIVNKVGSLTGCVSYYVMSYLVFMTFCQNMFNLPTQWGSDGEDIADGIKKAITDPFQYVVSVIWLPYSTVDFVNRGLVDTITSGNITVGYDTVAIAGTAYSMKNSILNIEFTNLISLTMPKHPAAATRGKYLNQEPYAHYFLSFYPFCGRVELDASQIGDKTTIYLVYTVDLRTGKGILNVCAGYTGTTYADWQPLNPIYTIEAQVGVNIPVSVIHTALPTNLGQMGVGAVASAMGQFGGFKGIGKKLLSTTSNWLADIVGASDATKQEINETIGATPINFGDISKIASTAMKSTAELKGSQGTISLNSRMPLILWGVFYWTTDEALYLNGRPLCKYQQLHAENDANALSGFVCCDKPKLQAPSGAYASEVAEIENYLTTGIFIE